MLKKSLSILSLSLFACSSHQTQVQTPEVPTADENPYAGDRMPASLASELKNDFFKTLKSMSHEQLDRLYYYGTLPKTLPLGKFDGVALVYNPQQGEVQGWWKALHNGIEGVDLVKKLTGLAWQGKVFSQDQSGGRTRDLENRLLFVAKGVHAKVYRGKMLMVLDQRFGVKRNFPGSFPEGAGMIRGNGLHLGMDPVYVDGGDSIIIDYQDTKPKSMRPIVDEIRLIESAGENHYLGRATFEGKFALFFALKPARTR